MKRFLQFLLSLFFLAMALVFSAQGVIVGGVIFLVLAIGSEGLFWYTASRALKTKKEP